jgi:hypothetical protein
VIDGYSIISAILNSPVPVDTYIDGLAASIAGVIAVAGRKCYISEGATAMIHDPHGCDDKKLLALFKDTLVAILSRRTKKTPEQISEMMSKETWFNHKQAVEAGIADESVPVPSKNKVKIPKTTNIASLELVYNQLLNPVKDMTKLNTLLKISNNADESEQEAAVVALNKSLTDKEAELTEVKNRLKTIEDAQAAAALVAKEALKTKATELANTLEKAGKITAEEKAGVIENASESEGKFQFVSNMFGKPTNTKESKKPFDFSKVANAAEDRSAWSFTDWSKKDDKGLAAMRNEAPDQFNALYKKEFPNSK